MPYPSHATILNELNVGIVVVDLNATILFWNNFMEIYSGRSVDMVIGKNLYFIFPDLNRKWLDRKLQSVWLLNSHSYISWKDIPYLFKFRHNRPITGYFEYMYQDVAFIPLRDHIGQIESIAIVINDVTDIGIYQHQLKEANDVIVMLEGIAQLDGLTNIFNRLKFENEFKNEFNRSRRYNRTFSFIMFDLDHFKAVNDNYGHLAGDEVLRVVAARTKNILRITDVFGRYGGEEFGIILPETIIDKAADVAERIRNIIKATPIFFENHPIPISASFGVTDNSNVAEYQNIIQRADESLYNSKHNGRNRVTCAK